MDPLLAARAQMAVSLGFHMVFAALGIGMPLLMAISEGLYLRTGRPHFLALARTWSKATALTFAIGAVSGTALAFELGLLWPGLIEYAGATLGPAFALEAWAFFFEAIFLGLYVYGWERLSPFVHWLVGLPVAVSGMASGVLVCAANAWMQTPVAHDVAPAARDALVVFQSPSWPHLAVHATLACYVATGFAAAGVYALGWLRGRRDGYHRSGLAIAMGVAAVASVLQLASGDHSARQVAAQQPLKFAAMESHFATGARAPLLLGGIPDPETGTVHAAIELPGMLSWLAHRDVDAVVAGLDQAPRELWPDVVVCHLCFQVMVGSAAVLLAVAAWYWLARRWPRLAGRALWGALVCTAPLGFVALEAGWVLTEVGRQPWTVYGVLRTADAVTPERATGTVFIAFVALYVVLGATLAVLLRRLAARTRHHGA